jgi:CPA2 family monovalent cation:H+ antiporter-2
MKSRTPVIVAARALNPQLTILVRARYLAERTTLDQMGANFVCYEEAEAAVALADILLREVGADEHRLLTEADKIRSELAVGRAHRAPPSNGSGLPGEHQDPAQG